MVRGNITIFRVMWPFIKKRRIVHTNSRRNNPTTIKTTTSPNYKFTVKIQRRRRENVGLHQRRHYGKLNRQLPIYVCTIHANASRGRRKLTPL